VPQTASNPNTPHFRLNGAVQQLFVDGKPMLLNAGELENSSGTSREWMAPIWKKCQQANLNCVLAAVPWDLFEPEEGKFDYKVIDDLIDDARSHGMKLVPLWFGAWKNGLSHYAPIWVKRDQQRFPRTRVGAGNLEMISTFSQEALAADAKAFAAFMRRIRERDEGQQTVIMVQLENEVGMNADYRDRHPLADAAFAGEVPSELMSYLVDNRAQLLPETLEFWSSGKASGTWSEVFGNEDKAGHVFMAWHYARFLDVVAAAGKTEYDIPVFANAALPKLSGHDRIHGPAARGGPIAAVMDIWRAAAPAIDMLSPDIYRPDFENVIAGFNRIGNPLFVPEARPELEGAANAFYTAGQGGIGYSPFAVEVRTADHVNGPLTHAYRLLGDIADVVLEHQAAGTITSVRVHPDQPLQKFDFGGYGWIVQRLTYWRNPDSPLRDWGYAVIMQTGPDTFLIAGYGIQIAHAALFRPGTIVGIGSLDEVDYRDGTWHRGRRLSGDEIMHSYLHAELNAHDQTGTVVKFWDPVPRCLSLELYTYQK
jgi:hypothetical protein